MGTGTTEVGDHLRAWEAEVFHGGGRGAKGGQGGLRGVRGRNVFPHVDPYGTISSFFVWGFKIAKKNAKKTSRLVYL